MSWHRSPSVSTPLPLCAPSPHCPSAFWTDTYNFSLSPLMFFYIICICICVFVSVSVSDSVLLPRPALVSVAVSVAVTVAVTLPCSRLLFQSPSPSSPSSCRYLYLIFLCARWKVTWISASTLCRHKTKCLSFHFYFINHIKLEFIRGSCEHRFSNARKLVNI